jgi:hypothetical protein
MKTKARKHVSTPAPEKRARFLQTDVPAVSLDNALRIPRAIFEHYAGRPASPLLVAAALEMSPISGQFRALTGASIAYGLTDGGYNAQEISIQSLAKRILMPLLEGDEAVAKREATLKPRILREFLTQYSGSPLPRQDIALNVLQGMGVPRDKAEPVYSLIVDSAQRVGLLRDIKGKQYVELTGGNLSSHAPGNDGKEAPSMPDSEADETRPHAFPVAEMPLREVSPERSQRVFITHGTNKSFLDPIKKLLQFGEMTPVISVEKQSVSKPVPDKVMDDMRSCSAAIIHVDAEEILTDNDGKERVILNQNVLMEIGAAMALYGRRFILLVRDGVRLPSNLQGLYEVRYKEDALDGDATIKLKEAINDIKNNPLPELNNLAA